jgi:hypothetical protein
VVVGRHGGYKTTFLINIAYGLFMRGYNVLYASLEMEARNVMSKLICRYTRKVDWTKFYKGYISEPQDWKRRDEFAAAAVDAALPEALRKKARSELAKYNEILAGIEPGKEESGIIEGAMAEIDARPNRLMICNVGQSRKIKVNQLEKWIEERREVFQPQVVLVDYLALVGADVEYTDRRDLEVGDICKYFRHMGSRMGFHVVTAAQYKRGAIERIRKYGFNNPEKAALNTDDIAESNQIGADADCVFMLWPEDGGNKLRIFTPKARYAPSDIDKGETVQVDQAHCTIAEDIESTEEQSNNVSISEALASAGRMVAGKPLASPIPDAMDDFDNFAGESSSPEDAQQADAIGGLA